MSSIYYFKIINIYYNYLNISYIILILNILDYVFFMLLKINKIITIKCICIKTFINYL